MEEKLDPRLLDLVQQAAAGLAEGAGPLDVLVALDGPLDDALGADLKARGLTTRSEIGAILTGSIRLADVRALAGSPRVIKVEASSPLYREPSERGEGHEE